MDHYNWPQFVSQDLTHLGVSVYENHVKMEEQNFYQAMPSNQMLDVFSGPWLTLS